MRVRTGKASLSGSECVWVCVGELSATTRTGRAQSKERDQEREERERTSGAEEADAPSECRSTPRSVAWARPRGSSAQGPRRLCPPARNAREGEEGAEGQNRDLVHAERRLSAAEAVPGVHRQQTLFRAPPAVPSPRCESTFPRRKLLDATTWSSRAAPLAGRGERRARGPAFQLACSMKSRLLEPAA